MTPLGVRVRMTPFQNESKVIFSYSSHQDLQFDTSYGCHLTRYAWAVKPQHKQTNLLRLTPCEGGVEAFLIP